MQEWIIQIPYFLVLPPRCFIGHLLLNPMAVSTRHFDLIRSVKTIYGNHCGVQSKRQRTLFKRIDGIQKSQVYIVQMQIQEMKQNHKHSIPNVMP